MAGKINKSIYDYFKGISKEDLLIVLEDLPKESQELLHRLFGPSYDLEIDKYNINQSEFQLFRRHYVPSILKKLKWIQQARDNNIVCKEDIIEFMHCHSHKTKTAIYDYFEGEAKENVNDAILMLTDEQIEVIKSCYGDDYCHHQKEVTDSNNYKRLSYTIINLIKKNLEILKTKNEKIKKENLVYIVLGLKYGYLKDKCYSNEEIASILNIPLMDVIEIEKREVQKLQMILTKFYINKVENEQTLKRRKEDE